MDQFTGGNDAWDSNSAYQQALAESDYRHDVAPYEPLPSKGSHAIKGSKATKGYSKETSSKMGKGIVYPSWPEPSSSKAEGKGYFPSWSASSSAGQPAPTKPPTKLTFAPFATSAPVAVEPPTVVVTPTHSGFPPSAAEFPPVN
jgi:hypothetical protein